MAAGGYQNKAYWPEATAANDWQGGRFRGRDKADDYGSPFHLANHPVVGVSWYEALAFCRWLTEKLQMTGDLEPKTDHTIDFQS